jgi:Protein of unknown function (DUF1688)
MLTAGAQALLSAAAVRKAAQRMLSLGLDGKLSEWRIDMDRLPATADFVTAVIRDRYPTLDIPLHARWRHFVFGGRDLGLDTLASQAWANPESRARAAFDLAITSVLLDAGSGPGWSYRDKSTGLTATRSEGLALASLRWFAAGGMSNDPDQPLRADASALQRLTATDLDSAFQASEQNPLTGAAGRAQLLVRLGATVQARPALFALADSPRPGGLFDVLKSRAVHGVLPAADILESLLDGLGSMWQNRPTLDGVPLGDCWPHSALRGPAPEDHFAPLHKLSQWLTYSLIEPLETAGIEVVQLDALTGLAEYRNGGLFVDMGVLVPQDAAAWSTTHEVADPFIVGWRSLTVALIDNLAPLVRERLNLGDDEFPLAKLLEGGTWAAGRRIANERRSGGRPPFSISSDGTVF